MIRALALVLVLAGGAQAQAQAQTSPAGAAQAAAERLERAAGMLSRAQSGEDRVTALTETVRAYEEGLIALREGLRRAAARQEALETDLEAKRGEVARLLGALQAVSRAPAPPVLLHPDGPVGTARAGMILAEAAPALQAEADALRADLEEVADLRAIQESAAQTLAQGLSGAQEARTALTAAIAARADLPRRFTEDSVAMALLIASTETLSAFASGLDRTVAEEFDLAAPDATARRGSLPLPAEGEIVRRYGDADAAGTERPGIILATPPRALVTTPAAATIRYHGPLLDYGNVVVLEPGPGVLWVFAGLSEVFGATGEILPAGAPVGLMGGTAPDPQAILTAADAEVEAPRSQTLYIEIREQQDTVDPGDWFVLE